MPGGGAAAASGLRSLWLAVLAWPYAHLGEAVHPLAVALLPLWWWAGLRLPGRRWWLLWAWSAPLLVFAWQAGSALGFWFRQAWAIWHRHPVWGLALYYRLPSLPDQGLALALLALASGTWAFWRAHSSSRVAGLMVGGSLAIVGVRVAGGVDTNWPLIAYVGLGLMLMADRQLAPVGWPRRSLAAALAAALPAASAVAIPPAAGHGSGFLATSLRMLTAHAGGFHTGLGIGDTNINHPVVPMDQPMFQVSGAPAPAYWQAAVYTRFNGTSWSGPTGSVYPARRAMPLLPWQFGRLPTQTWTITVRWLHGQAASLVYTGQPIRLGAASPPGPAVALPDLMQIRGSFKRYTLVAEVPELPTALLASAPYQPLPPALDRDLELPASLSPRVVALARRIAGHAPGPFAAAQALKQYLDSHEHYSFDFPPTAGADVVNAFLFSTHAGYCDQFSTAFVMMARALGIPARWVVGYGPGTYDANTGTYLVRASDAHSWAQIWVAPYGWIPFDPTPGWALPQAVPPGQAVAEQVTPTQRVTLPPAVPATAAPTPAPSAPAPAPVVPLSFPWAPAAASAGGVAIAIALAGWRSRRRTAAAQLEAVRRRLFWAAALGRRHRPPPSETWREWIAPLPEALRRRLWPSVHLLETARFGGQPPSAETLAAARRGLSEALRWWIGHRISTFWRKW